MILSVAEVIHERIIESSDAALLNFGAAVRPIYGSNQAGEPDHIGSSILLDLKEGKFLLTAAHVIDWNDRTTLYVGGDDALETLQFDAFLSKAPDGNRKSDQADFAIARLSHKHIECLSTAYFIPEYLISRSVEETSGRLYACLGFPNSRNRVKSAKYTGRRNVNSELNIYTSLGMSIEKLATANETDHILVDRHPKYSKDETGKKVNAIALPGFSGGAIVDLGRINPESLDKAIEPKLAALLIEGHSAEKVILGTRIARVLAVLRDANVL